MGELICNLNCKMMENIEYYELAISLPMINGIILIWN